MTYYLAAEAAAVSAWGGRHCGELLRYDWIVEQVGCGALSAVLAQNREPTASALSNIPNTTREEQNSCG